MFKLIGCEFKHSSFLLGLKEVYMKKKANLLTDIDVFELSFCKSPANKKRYLFTKNGNEVKKQTFDNLNIQIDSDGSVEGTQFVVNGEVLSNVEYFNFNFDKQAYADSLGPALECSYGKNKTEGNGFVGIENYRLSKTEVNKMITKMQEGLKKFFGEDVKSEEVVAFKKSETFVATIEKAINTINEYSDSFPEDLKEAVGSIVKGTLVEEEANTDDKKKDVKLEKNEEPADENKDAEPPADTKADETTNEEEDKEGKDEVEKALKGVTESINNLQTEFKKSFEKFDERLKKVETIKGNKQGLDGQDTETDIKKGEEDSPKWKSFFAQ
jgi:hypothetical protein